jgi:hypothetical protein
MEQQSSGWPWVEDDDDSWAPPPEDFQYDDVEDVRLEFAVRRYIEHRDDIVKGGAIASSSSRFRAARSSNGGEWESISLDEFIELTGIKVEDPGVDD